MTARGATVTVKAGDLEPFVGKIVRDNGVLITLRSEGGEEIEVVHAQIESGEAELDVAPETIPLSEQALSRITPPEGAKVEPIAHEEALRLAGVIERVAAKSG